MNGTALTTSTLGNSETLIGVIEAISPAVGLHARRVSAYSARLAMQYGLPAGMIETIRVGALLHDVGKLLIPSRLLTKPGPLTKREWNQLRSHPELGSDLVKRLGFTDEVAEVVSALVPLAPEATLALDHVEHLRAACDRAGNLPRSRRSELGTLVGMLEARLQ